MSYISYKNALKPCIYWTSGSFGTVTNELQLVTKLVTN